MVVSKLVCEEGAQIDIASNFVARFYERSLCDGDVRIASSFDATQLWFNHDLSEFVEFKKSLKKDYTLVRAIDSSSRLSGNKLFGCSQLEDIVVTTIDEVGEFWLTAKVVGIGSLVEWNEIEERLSTESLLVCPIADMPFPYPDPVTQPEWFLIAKIMRYKDKYELPDDKAEADQIRRRALLHERSLLIIDLNLNRNREIERDNRAPLRKPLTGAQRERGDSLVHVSRSDYATGTAAETPADVVEKIEKEKDDEVDLTDEGHVRNGMREKEKKNGGRSRNRFAAEGGHHCTPLAVDERKSSTIVVVLLVGNRGGRVPVAILSIVVAGWWSCCQGRRSLATACRSL
nr:replication protein A 70 kDa DNA-binding subunit B-like [Ipomoea batatas]